jgi:hypothetical protein
MNDVGMVYINECVEMGAKGQYVVTLDLTLCNYFHGIALVTALVNTLFDLSAGPLP